MVAKKRTTKRSTIPSLRKRFKPETTSSVTASKREAAKKEGAIWTPKWIRHPTKSGRQRLVYVKTTPERQTSARNLKTSRGNDLGLVEKGRAKTDDGSGVASSGANLHPWLYGGLPGRHKSVFGSQSPIGQKFVGDMEARVKANAANGKTTHLLDIGAGLGQHWRPVLNKLRKHGEVELHVLNPSRWGVEHSPADHWHTGMVETYNFGRQKFDGVVCTYGGFDKSEHPKETMRKMARLTAKGGRQYLIFGRKELGEGSPVTREEMEAILHSSGKGFKVTDWSEPSGPRRTSAKAYRKDLLFTRN
jgi:hypothetical protein